MFKSYSNILSEKTVIVLGAGASRDYGFPLWEDLKGLLIAHCAKNPFPSVIKPKILLEVADAIQTMKRNQTIDKVATEFGIAEYDAFKAILGLSVIQAEAADKQSETKGWMEVFRLNLARTVISIEKDSFDEAVKAMSNIRFISLNYDRTFQHRFVEPFFKHIQRGFSKGNARKISERRTDGFIQQTAIGTFNLFQPHGIVAQLRAAGEMGLNQVIRQYPNHDQQKVIPYGDIQKYTSLINSGWRPNIRVVDDFDRIDPSNHPTYGHCNERISGARVYLAGLSEAGITNSRFDLTKAGSVGTNLSTNKLSTATKAFIGPRLLENNGEIYLEPLFKRMTKES